MKSRFSLAYYIVLLIVFTALSMTLPLYYTGVASLRSIVNTGESQKAESISYMAKAIIQEEVERLSVLANTLKYHSGLTEGIVNYNKNGNKAEFKSLIDDICAGIETDQIIITDSNGNIIYQTFEAYGPEIVKSIPAIADKEGVMISKYSHGLAISVKTDIFREAKNDSTVIIHEATIIISTLINNKFAKKIADITNSRIDIGSIHGVTARSHFSPGKVKNEEEIEKIMLQSISENQIFRRAYDELGINIYFEPFYISNTPLCLIAEIDTAAFGENFIHNRQKVIVTASIALLLSLSVGSIFIVWLIKPLKNLKNNAEKITERVTGITSQKQQGNEVLSLVDAFKVMSKEITDHISERTRTLETTQKILQAIPVGVVIVGKDKKIRMANDAALRMIGVSSPDQIIGKSCQIICFSGRELCPVIDLNETVDYAEQVLVASDGKQVPILKNVTPIVLNEKEEVLLEVFTDISRWKNAERELAKHRDHLEEMVDERTSELAQAKEIAENATKQLQEHARLKSEFTICVTHELRTPLAIFKNIISNALAGIYGKIRPGFKEQLKIADQNINRLGRIISDFFDIAKLDAGKSKLELVPWRIQSIVEEVIRALKCMAESKNMLIETSMPDEDLIVDIDNNKVVQVLENLLENAIKFVPDCGGKIIIRVIDLDDEYRIEVEDNGPGIDSDDINKVFDRFVQVEKQTGPGAHGTGLGLAVTKELIEMHGGRIWVDNVPDGGARFCFIMPKRIAEKQTDLENVADGIDSLNSQISRLSEMCYENGSESMPEKESEDTELYNKGETS